MAPNPLDALPFTATGVTLHVHGAHNPDEAMTAARLLAPTIDMPGTATERVSDAAGVRAAVIDAPPTHYPHRTVYVFITD